MPYRSSVKRRVYEYVPGTYQLIPRSLRSWKDRYRKIGRNLFVVTSNPASSNTDILKALRSNTQTVGDVLTAFATTPKLRAALLPVSDKTTVGAVVLAALGRTLMPATEMQIADYERRRGAYLEYCAKAKAKLAERRAAHKQKEIDKALKFLRANGVKIGGV